MVIRITTIEKCIKKPCLRENRFDKSEFTHEKLVDQGFDPNKTEHEIMFERGIYRIYDSGSLKFVYKP